MFLSISIGLSQVDTLVVHSIADSITTFIPIPNEGLQYSLGETGAIGVNITLPKQFDDNVNYMTIQTFADSLFDLSDHPISANVALVWSNDIISKSATCSGTLVHRNIVITDAHCITTSTPEKIVWKERRDLKVSPAHSGGYPNENFGEVGVTHLIIPKKYYDGGISNLKYDFALLVLDQNIGDEAGWYGLKNLTENNFLDTTMSYHFSYPATSGYDGKDMYFSHGKISTLHSTFRTGVNHVQGESGSSFFYMEDNMPVIYGLLHTLSTQFFLPEKFVTGFDLIREKYALTTTGILNEVETSVFVYPNPTIDLVNIKSKDKNIIKVELTDVSGNVLDVVNVESRTVTLSMEQYKEGLYYLRICFSNGNQIVKLMKE